MRRRHLALALSISVVLAAAPALRAQGGHFEFGGHYGRWSLNILGRVAEDLLSDAIDTELQDRILEGIRDDYPNLNMTSYSQDLRFDSKGDDFGVGFRWYPGGHRGSFSLGSCARWSFVWVSEQTGTSIGEEHQICSIL